MRTLSFNSFLMITALLLSSQLYAQSNFEKGYIIMPNGDTVHGLIDNRQWELHPTSIAYKASDDANIIWYSPSEILGFGVGIFIFTSALVEFDDSLHKLEHLTESSEPNMVEKNLFIQVIFQGEKSLYFHKDINGKPYFFIETNGEIGWLYFKRYINISESVNRSTRSASNIRSINTYKGQLQLYFHDCSVLKSTIEKADYTLTDLYRIFEKYYELCNGNIDFKMERIKPVLKYKLDLLAGLTITQINFDGTVRPWLTEPEFPSSIDFAAGIGFEVRFPHDNYKLSLYNELSYNQMSTQASHLYYSMGAYQTYKHSSFNFKYLKIRSSGQYNFNIGEARLFANAGLAIGFFLSLENLLITEKIQNTIITEEFGPALPPSRMFDPGLVIGLGANYKRLNVRGDFEISKGPSLVLGLGSVTKRLSLTLGYTILQ
jgi:hypothetical protein